MMILDKEGVPRLLQWVSYHSGMRWFECEWFDGSRSKIVIDYLPSNLYNGWNYMINKHKMYDYSIVQDYLETFYKDR